MCRRPIATILDPFLFGWEKCQPCIPGYLKRFKNGQNSPYAHLMQSIASLSPGLRYIIQPSGHWHHHNGLAYRKSRFFWGTRDFLSSRPIWTFTARKGAFQTLNYRANLTWEFFFLKCEVKICRNRPTCFSFRPDTLDRPF